MAYCSNCGAPLAGVKRFCASCGFKVEELPEEPNDIDIMEAEVVEEDRPQQPTIDRTCGECDNDAEHKCYFCWTNICHKHTTKLQIFINKAPFGNTVVSCRRCADEKNGEQPTKSEAEGASLFFGVKPYHAWKIVK